MKAKKVMSALLSGVMLMTSGGIIPVMAEETENSITGLDSLTVENKLFDVSEYYTSDTENMLVSGAGWTLDTETTLTKIDEAPVFLNVGTTANEEVIMGENGYGRDNSWIAVEFVPGSISGYADTYIADAYGNKITAYCFAGDGFWIGHGERSCGGQTAITNDAYGTCRFTNYLKNEIGTSEAQNTGKLVFNGTSDTVTMIVENGSGTLDNIIAFNSVSGGTYKGDYYTVKTYKNETLVSTEYYAGHRYGIKSLNAFTTATASYGNLKIYGGGEQKLAEIDAMLTSENTKLDLSKDALPEEWTVPLNNGTGLDNSKFLHRPTDTTLIMSEGYGAKAKWYGVGFIPSNWDDAIIPTCLYDTDDNPITAFAFGRHYQKRNNNITVQSTGISAGGGENAFAEAANNEGIKDAAERVRFSNYLKSDITVSVAQNEGKFNFLDSGNRLEVIVENHNGTVENVLCNADENSTSYTGAYYTVKTYKDKMLISTEYYTGNRKGIKSIQSGTGAVTYYGDMKVYAGLDMEDTPNISINYTDETLTGFVESGYTVDGIAVSPKNGAVNISDIKYENTEKTVSIIKTGDGTTTVDSFAKSLTIPARPSAPTGLESTAVQTENGSDGTITGVDDTMEYKAENADEWTAVAESATTVTNLEAGTYNVRYKTTENNFASANATVIVGGYVEPTKTQETTPAIAIDYMAEELTGFETGASYTIKVGEGAASEVSFDNGKIAIDEAYFGNTVYIVRTARDNSYIDSIAQVLSIPARPAVPDSIKINNATEQVTIPTNYLYGTTDSDYENITTVGADTGVSVEAETSIYIYKTAVADGENKAFKSAVKTLTAPSKAAQPAILGIDYSTETIYTKSDVQYLNGEEWKAYTNNTDVKDFGWNGTAKVTVQFRTPSNETSYASDSVSVEIPTRPAAPNVTGGKGKITGTTAKMSYSANQTDWSPCTDTETTVAAGKYYVVDGATSSAFKSFAAEVTVESAGSDNPNPSPDTTPVVSAGEGDLKDLTLPYTEEGYKVAGNITLPETFGGHNISWTADKSEIIKTTEEAITGQSANYTKYPAGRVTRPTGADTAVKLTASYTDNDKTYTKDFNVTVKKAPAMNYAEMSEKLPNEGGFAGYLYASFIEPPTSVIGQQTYFAISDDGLNWKELNGDNPVLTSNLGTKGLRDHYLIRSPEGDRFYLIATDLDASGSKWTDYGEKGSKYIMVWESDDLVNWSKQRMVQVADLDDSTSSGCAWAPEAIYDDITGEYIMYWSATDMNPANSSYKKKVVYYSKTRDFHSFTPQKKFVEPYVDAENSANNDGNKQYTSDSFIDTTMIKGSDNKFYRVTKFEDMSKWNCGTKVFMDVSDAPLGEFTRVKTNLSADDFDGVEGPGWFRFNKDDQTADKKYCLMLDGYNGKNDKVGFFPNTVGDLNWTDENTTINFTKVTSGFRMRNAAKHGGILPVTQAEYDELTEAYSVPEPEYTDDVPTALIDYNFDDGEKPSGATFTGNTSVVDEGEIDGKALYMKTDGYMTIPVPKDENSNVLESFTVSFDVKNYTTGNYFTFAISDGQRRSAGSNYLGIKAADSVLISTSNNQGAEKKTTVSAGTVQNKWTHFDIVVSNGVTQVYVNKELKGTLNGYMMKDINPSVLVFGQSPWSADKFADAHYDNIKVYPAALSAKAVLGAAAPDQRPQVISDHLLFGMNFNDESSVAYKGKAVVNGELSFDYGTDYSSAAKFTNNGTYIEAQRADGKSPITGLDEFTISYQAKTAANPSWWFYAAPNGDKITYMYEKYLGMVDSATKMLSERYNNNGTRSDVLEYNYTDGAWHQVDIVTAKNTSTLYVDGKMVDTIESAVDVKELLGDNSVFYIGKAPWNNGEYANGIIDDYEIYDFAPEIDFGNVDLRKVTSNITLPSATEAEDGYAITWSSSDTTLLESNGTVHRPATGKHRVTLTAKIKYGNHELSRDFEVIVCGDVYNDFNLKITAEKGVDIQPNMYGLFFEDINFAADGGLYAEMVENRSFEEIMHDNKDAGTAGHTWADPGYAWNAVDGTMKYDKTENPLHENNTHYLNFTGKSFKNQAYDGMYIEKDKEYIVSLYARVGGYTGGITAKTVKDNKTGFSVKLTSDNIVDSEFSKNGWAKYEAKVKASDTVRYSDFIIELDSSVTVDFDVISVMPDDAIEGIFRKDLAEKLKDLNPGFLRFPGGCIIEGWDLDNAYNWKDSVGPIEERKQNWNRWATTNPYNQYNQTYGLGYYEYFVLCEYLDCDPVPVQNVGMACEYQGGSSKNGYQSAPIYKEGTTEYTDEFYKYIQDTLDLIEFANSTDFANSEWAQLRRDMGHPAPFNLEMIGIGNEQWEAGGNQWHTRYEAFEAEIHKRYPDIKLISTSGPVKSDEDWPQNTFGSAWSWIRENQAANNKFTYAVDEHYYVATSWFYDNDNRYDDYDRGTKVFAGEYAAWTDINADGTVGARNNLDSALAEASFMTGLERNADVVYMASYAPLFARLGYVQWNPDMIWFDDVSSFATSDYWVQHMYMNNNGDYTLKSEVTENIDKVYQTVSFDKKSGDIIIKVANPMNEEKQIAISFDNSLDITGSATVETLKGTNLADCNSITEPDKIKPETVNVTGVTASYTHKIPALSFQVIRVKTENGQGDNTIVIDKVSTSANSVNYALKAGANFDSNAYDVYTAVYDKDGVLAGVTMNNMQGSAPIDKSGEYTVKMFVWNKGTMQPSDIPMDNKTINISSYVEIETEEIAVAKSTLGNPITGFDADGNLIYGGDVAPLVVNAGTDDETMYVYVGHDAAPVSQDKYIIPEWICYSSKDLVNWDYHGVIMDASQQTIPWAKNNKLDAWASQVIEHNGKYYLYFCTFGNQTISRGRSCIGVAVSNSPTGPFVPYVADGETENKPLVNGFALGLDDMGASHWEIDPTVWIETVNGKEHIYLNWGNTYNITCELNADMVSVKDLNGDNQITKADFVTSKIIEGNSDIVGSAAEAADGQHNYREAPWIYRRKDASGNYTGDYYMFFADGWRESYAYATTDNLMSGQWKYKGLIMDVNATADTSHGGVVDFKGKTYYVYHNGSLPSGSGYRRVANIQELKFNADGSIDKMEELSTGISGWSTSIKTSNNKFVGHESFVNPKDGNEYPIVKDVTVETEERVNDTQWELKKGKYNTENPYYVSIQSVNKPGLYITASKSGGVRLTQHHNKLSNAEAQMTFKTVKALNGKDDMVSFESVSAPGYYLTVENDKLVLSYGADKDSASFSFGNDKAINGNNGN